MKTLNIFAAALITTLSLNAFAAEKTDEKLYREAEKTTTLISLPEMEWGNPADVNSGSVEELKSGLLLKAPEMIWGSPEELNLEALESLKNARLFPAPEMVWGNPEDVYSFDAGK